MYTNNIIKEKYDKNLYILKTIVGNVYAENLTQINMETKIAKILMNNPYVEHYDMSLMIPKVTYDDWCVCLYKKDNKFYRIDEEDIIEVIPVEILKYNSKFQAIDENGNRVPDKKLHNYCDNLCCGEADDMSCYVYFDVQLKS